VQVSSQLNATTSSTTADPSVTSGSSSNNVSYYTVNPDGDIDFPVIGKMHIAGMTRYEISQYIKNRLESENLAKEPIVSVEFVNTGITVLGSVGSPGRFEFNKDKLTIVDAIAMAGDLNINGQREDIMVIRQLGDGREQAYFIDMTDAKTLYSSPVYYLQQNDIVYVSPNDKVKRETTPNGNTPFTPSFWMSLCSFAITVVTLAITLTK
jgi:polysaccharide export outer membrane protein